MHHEVSNPVNSSRGSAVDVDDPQDDDLQVHALYDQDAPLHARDPAMRGSVSAQRTFEFDLKQTVSS